MMSTTDMILSFAASRNRFTLCELSDHVRSREVISDSGIGVIVAASVWSLLIQSMEMTGKTGLMSVIPDIVGFALGIGFFFCSI